MDGMVFYIASVSDEDGLYASELIWCDGDREAAWSLLECYGELRTEARRIGVPVRLDGPFTIPSEEA